MMQRQWHDHMDREMKHTDRGISMYIEIDKGHKDRDMIIWLEE
jgi:hypothetical protein